MFYVAVYAYIAHLSSCHKTKRHFKWKLPVENYFEVLISNENIKFLQ